MVVLTVSSGNSMESFLQLITVLIIFIAVLFAALYTSKWIAGYQKQHRGKNIDIIESAAIANGKYLQIVRLGDTYVALVVCKDTVTYLTAIPKEEIVFPEENVKSASRFKELFQKAKNDGKDENNKDEEKPEE